MVVELDLSEMRQVIRKDFLALGFIEVEAEQPPELNFQSSIIERLHRLTRA